MEPHHERRHGPGWREGAGAVHVADRLSQRLGHPKKRRLSLVTSIEGFRAIAARTGNSFINDDTLKADTNPAGVVTARGQIARPGPRS
jgi:hypothetical protein